MVDDSDDEMNFENLPTTFSKSSYAVLGIAPSLLGEDDSNKDLYDLEIDDASEYDEDELDEDNEGEDDSNKDLYDLEIDDTSEYDEDELEESIFVSKEAYQIALTKDVNWEFLLFNQILFDGIQELKSRDVTVSSSYKEWIGMLFSAYSNLVNTLPDLLNTHYQPSMETARQTGCSNSILEFTTEIIALTSCIYMAREEMILFSIPEELENFTQALVTSCEHQANEIRAWVEDMQLNTPIAVEKSENTGYALQLTTPPSFDMMINNLDTLSAYLSA